VPNRKCKAPLATGTGSDVGFDALEDATIACNLNSKCAGIYDTRDNGVDYWSAGVEGKRADTSADVTKPNFFISFRWSAEKGDLYWLCEDKQDGKGGHSFDVRAVPIAC